MKTRPRWASTLVALALAMSGASAQAPLDVRVALVIGNAAYPGPAALPNPVNDARAMSQALRQLGFEVVEVRDADKAQMAAAVARARQLLDKRQGVAMLYYAGHGLQIDWRNYMVPVDARLASAADVPQQSVDVASVVEAFRAAASRLNIVVLDACRDNPFPAPASGRGLAPMDAPPGTLLAYATAPGNVASDGDGGNGLYTQFLLQELGRPQARIEDVFKRVRFQVRQKSQGRQVPWESTSLEDDFYFDSGRKVAPPDEAEKARMFVQEKAEWDRIKDNRSADDVYGFLSRHPNGLIAEHAQATLERLQKAGVQPQLPPAIAAMPAPSARRFYQGDELVYDLVDGFTRQAQRYTQRVTLATDERVEINGGIVVTDQVGTILRNRFGTHQPGILVVPSELAVGRRWRTAYETQRPDGVKETSYWEFRVPALEDVTVPAGTFKAFRIEGRGEARPQGGGIIHLTTTRWVEPATLMVLRNDLLFRTTGRVAEHSSTVLVSRRLVPRPQ